MKIGSGWLSMSLCSDTLVKGGAMVWYCLRPFWNGLGTSYISPLHDSWTMQAVGLLGLRTKHSRCSIWI
jgi:hypothetical protein